MLGRSLEQNNFDDEGRTLPSRTLSFALARVWSDLQINPDIRQIAALGLKGMQAWPAFEICLQRLPLADHPDRHLAHEVEHLLKGWLSIVFR